MSKDSEVDNKAIAHRSLQDLATRSATLARRGLDHVLSIERFRIPYRKGTKWGFVDDTIRMAIPPSFEDLEPFNEGLAAAKQGGNWGFINKLGATVVPYIYDSVTDFQGGFAVVKYKGNKGAISQKGDVAIPLIYDFVGPYSDGLARVGIGFGLESTHPWLAQVKYGYVDLSGNVVIPLDFESASDFKDGIAEVRYTGSYETVIDKMGTEIVPPGELIRRRENSLIVSNGGKWVIYDLQGNQISGKYDEAWEGNEELFVVETSGRWGFLSYKGAEVVPLIYDFVSIFHDGLACVVRDGRLGLIDPSGNVILEPTFEVRNEHFNPYFQFEDGFCRVNHRGKWGVINAKGNVVVPFKYEEIGKSASGLFPVKRGGRWGVIDSEGSIRVGLDYDYATCDPTGHCELLLGNKYGICDTSGDIFTDFDFDEVRGFSNKLIQVWIGEECGLIDRIGNEVVPIKYFCVREIKGSTTLVRAGLYGPGGKPPRAFLRGYYGESSDYFGEDGTRYFED